MLRFAVLVFESCKGLLVAQQCSKQGCSACSKLARLLLLALLLCVCLMKGISRHCACRLIHLLLFLSDVMHRSRFCRALQVCCCCVQCCCLCWR
jgi:hypothetical protein